MRTRELRCGFYRRFMEELVSDDVTRTPQGFGRVVQLPGKLGTYDTPRGVVRAIPLKSHFGKYDCQALSARLRCKLGTDDCHDQKSVWAFRLKCLQRCLAYKKTHPPRILP